MTRLRHPPSKLPPRVLTLCLAVTLALLWREGATLGESWSLVVGLLPLEPGGASALRLLLGRMVATFFLLSFALLAGLSSALALAMIVSRLGGRVARFTGWAARLLTGVPPMAWTLGAVVWLIRVRGLPVETLFPYQPAPESDSIALRLGRDLWAWIVPVLVLAIPVLGTAVFSLTHKLSSLLRDPVVGRLRGRGLRQTQILYRHLVPLMRVHQARLARPAAALLLAYDIPVEELLGFPGWGSFAAGQLLSPAASGRALAAVFWSGSLILTAVLAWLSLLDRQGLPQDAEQDSDPGQHRSARSAACGAGLMLFLLLPARWFVPEAMRGSFEIAQAAWTAEIARAVAVALAALATVVAASFLMSLLRSRLFGRGWAAALALTPLLVTLLFREKEYGRSWGAIALAVAIPGIVAFREAFRDADGSDFIEASRAMGQNRPGIWWHHVLPGALPSLPGLALRNAGAALMMFCVLDFYAGATTGTWGGQMRAQAERALDDPVPALVPALLLALWSLSFRLLSRASGNGQPPPRTTPFDR
jgi:ABC-type dipeptide/oligopeptide/nickel transport system permease component